MSDTQLIIADKTDSEPKNRTTRVRFTLKGMEFDPDAKYYLNIVMKETGSLTEQIEFSIKIAFANDFDF
ncbi:MAG: hypothetical protein IKR76_03170 [Ruminococcus sp.]|nr:hypothetical protein [Ruminococcus sp.]